VLDPVDPGVPEPLRGAGLTAEGQPVGVLDDLPTREELLDRVVDQAARELRRLSVLLAD